MIWLGISQLSFRAVQGGLSVSSTVPGDRDGVVLAAGWELPIVGNRELSVALRQTRLLMDIRLKGSVARSCDVRGLAQSHAREECVLLLRIQLVLYV